MNSRADLCLAAFLAGAAALALPASAQSVEERLKALESQNAALQKQLADQQRVIEDLKEGSGSSHADPDPATRDIAKSGFDFGRVHLSGEGGAAFFSTDSDGAYPHSTFRIDEAKLFVEAPLWEDTYFFGELDLATREANDEFFHLGELYLDFENVVRHWTDHNWLSVRAGRFYIPFGEEYNARYAIDNPLISHSLTDFWGVDEGVELYGSGYGFDYVVAVQNGGHPTLKDFNSDKSVAGRIGYNFSDRARLSVSAMRTGDLSPTEDKMSELWFANGFFRSVGPAASTSAYHADLYELDAQTFWKSGHLKLAGGYLKYDDNDTAAENSRDGYYYYAEVLQKLPHKFYTAGRFSQVISSRGMPIVGLGDFGDYYFGPLTRDLWRLSIGLGYKWSENLVTKIEYAREEGSLAAGAGPVRHHFVGAEFAFKF